MNAQMVIVENVVSEYVCRGGKWVTESYTLRTLEYRYPASIEKAAQAIRQDAPQAAGESAKDMS